MPILRPLPRILIFSVRHPILRGAFKQIFPVQSERNWSKGYFENLNQQNLILGNYESDGATKL